MSDIWDGATWNEYGELVLGIYAEPPTEEIEEESEDFDDVFPNIHMLQLIVVANVAGVLR